MILAVIIQYDDSPYRQTRGWPAYNSINAMYFSTREFDGALLCVVASMRGVGAARAPNHLSCTPPRPAPAATTHCAASAPPPQPTPTHLHPPSPPCAPLYPPSGGRDGGGSGLAHHPGAGRNRGPVGQRQGGGAQRRRGGGRGAPPPSPKVPSRGKRGVLVKSRCMGGTLPARQLVDRGGRGGHEGSPCFSPARRYPQTEGQSMAGRRLAGGGGGRGG